MPRTGERRKSLRNTAERNRLVTENIKLARWFLVYFRERWPLLARALVSASDFDDAEQEATLGLMRAAELWEPAKGAFPTYARHWIFEAVSKWVFNRGIIHVPGAVQRDRIEHYSPRHREDVRRKGRAAHRVKTIHVSEGRKSKHPPAPANEHDFLLDELLARTWKRLTSEEQRILTERFWEESTLEKIGARTGVTKEAVRARLIHICKKMRRLMGPHGAAS